MISKNVLANVRVALVHDWLMTSRGGEKVLEAIQMAWIDEAR